MALHGWANGLDVSKDRSVLALKLKQPKKNCLTPVLKPLRSTETSVIAPLAMQRHHPENLLAQQHNGGNLKYLAVLRRLAYFYQ
jgi:hypothetical protein